MHKKLSKYIVSRTKQVATNIAKQSEIKNIKKFIIFVTRLFMSTHKIFISLNLLAYVLNL